MRLVVQEISVTNSYYHKWYCHYECGFCCNVLFESLGQLLGFFFFYRVISQQCWLDKNSWNVLGKYPKDFHNTLQIKHVLVTILFESLNCKQYHLHLFYFILFLFFLFIYFFWPVLFFYWNILVSLEIMTFFFWSIFIENISFQY